LSHRFIHPTNPALPNRAHSISTFF